MKLLESLMTFIESQYKSFIKATASPSAKILMHTKKMVIGLVLSIAAISPMLINLQSSLDSTSKAIAWAQENNSQKLRLDMSQANNKPTINQPTSTPEPAPEPTTTPQLALTESDSSSAQSNNNPPSQSHSCQVNQTSKNKGRQKQIIGDLQLNPGATDEQINQWLDSQGLKGQLRKQAKSAARSWRDSQNNLASQLCTEIKNQLSNF